MEEYEQQNNNYVRLTQHVDDGWHSAKIINAAYAVRILKEGRQTIVEFDMQVDEKNIYLKIDENIAPSKRNLQSAGVMMAALGRKDVYKLDPLQILAESAGKQVYFLLEDGGLVDVVSPVEYQNILAKSLSNL